MAPLYATRADVEAYIEGWVTDDAAALDRLIERAERDIDALFPLRPIITAGTYAGRAFDPTLMLEHERDALARAVCAQVEYRFAVGEEDLVGAGPVRVKGPDFEVEHAKGAGGTRQRYSPKLAGELRPLARYKTLTARARP